MGREVGLGTILDPIRKKLTDDPGNLFPMSITALSVSGIGGGSATVSWTTGSSQSGAPGGGAGTSRVMYGVSPNRDQSTATTDVGGVTSHSVTLTGLTVGKVYLYRVESRYAVGTDGAGRSVTDGYAFTSDGSFVA